MPLSAAQLLDLRSDLGLPAAPGVFTDDELQRNYERAGSYYGAAVITIRQLRSDAAKRNDYATGQTKESASQIFKMLGELLEDFEEQRDLEEGQNVAQMAALRPVPTTTNAPTPDGYTPSAWRRNIR